MGNAPRSLLAHLTDGIMLLWALQVTVWGAVTAYGIEVEGLRLTLTLCLLALGSLLLSTLPAKGRSLAVPAVLVLWGLRLWRGWERLSWGAAWVWCDLVNTLAREMPGLSEIEPGLVLPAEEWAAMATDWLTVAALPLALALGWLLCRRRKGLGVVLLTLLPLLPALLVTEAPAPWALAGLLGLWGVLVLGSITDEADPDGTARGRLPAGVAMALVLALLMQNLPTTGRRQPDWAADLRESALNSAGRLSLGDLWRRQEWHLFGGTGSSRQVDLLSRPTFSGRVALRVESRAAGTHLLRGWSAETYTNGSWGPLGREAQEELDALREQGLEPLLMLGESITDAVEQINWGGSSGYRAQMTVENVSAPGSCVYCPYALYFAPEGTEPDGAHLGRKQGWSHTFDYCPSYEWVVGRGGSYYWTSLLEPNPVKEAYRDFVYKEYLTVDETDRQVLLDWWADNAGVWTSLDEYILSQFRGGEWNYLRAATEEETANPDGWDLLPGDLLVMDGKVYGWEETEGPISDEERLYYRDRYRESVTYRLEQALAETTAYDLNAPLCPEGENYLDHFLNESRRGWCMHYATVTALMLRCLGIPTRYVSGYVAHPTVRSPAAEVRDYDAHAWVEYYLDGIGWLPLDLTPQAGYGSAATEAQETETPSPSVTGSAVPSTEPTQAPTTSPTAEVTPSAAPTQAPQPGENTGEKPAENGGPDPLILLWPAGALALSWALWSGYCRRRRERLTQPDTNAAVLWAYALGEKLGPWGGQGSEERTALAQKARFSQHILTEEERQRALDLLLEEIQAISKALPRWKGPIFRALWGDLAAKLGEKG